MPKFLQATFRRFELEAKHGLVYIRPSVNRLPVNPLIMRGLQLAEDELGLDGLATRLGIRGGEIDDWRIGRAGMPQDKFLELVDFLASIDPSWHRSNPAALAASAVKRIIVVDDNADGAITLTHLLEVLGHQAMPVIDSRKALELAKEVRPHIAILDINMPHLDGLQLARLFRAQAELKDCHLVALTAMDSVDYREKTRQVGFDAHLRKPADAAMLRAIIAQFQDPPRG